MKSILVNSLLCLALCCSCRAKEKIVLDRTEASKLEARHEAINYNITISDVIIDDSGKTSIKPTKEIEIKGNRVDTTKSVVTSNKVKQPIQNTNRTSNEFKLMFLLIIAVVIILVFGAIALVLALVKR